jgi:hypothetical protein
MDFFRAMEGGQKRACLVWHRRAGKDTTVLNFTAKRMFEEVGTYWHLFPKQTQARRAIWRGINNQGQRIINQVFPPAVRARDPVEQDMVLELVSGSMWQLCGSDNYDNLVGSNVKGVVFSEWSLCNPAAWDYVRPILAENNGWAAFIYTPRGKNHGYKMFEMAQANPNWFCQRLTAHDTRREDGTPVITPEILAEERASGMTEAMVQQEYFCSFDAPVPGAFYVDELERARVEQRIGRVPIEPQLSLHTAWDLGVSDSTAIWFFQTIGKEVRVLHYYENHNKGMDHYINYIKQWASSHQLMLGDHFAPHDIEVREFTSGTSRQETALQMGFRFIKTQRPKSKAEGINAVRRVFPMLWIDDVGAANGLSCLTNYHRQWSEQRQTYVEIPHHDWASHGADAMQTLALGWQMASAGGQPKSMRHGQPNPVAKANFSVFT